MMRLSLVVAAAILAAAGCSRAPAPAPFPETIGPWRRVALRDLPASSPPDPIPANLVRSIREATYEGAGKLDARVYTLPSAAAALDLAQRWRPAPQTVFFESGPYFVVVHWEKAERPALQIFLAGLEKRFQQK
jgi:hypothetical protein